MTSKTALLLVGVIGLGALVACGGGGGSTNNTASVTLSPHLAEVAAGVQNQTFTATLSGSGSAAGVTWSVDGVANGDSTTGVISASGVYTAPATAGTHTVTATSVSDTSKSDSATVAVTDLAGVFTYHNNLARDGTNIQEYLLSGTTVTQSTFGKLFACPVDGAVYTQPLWVPGVSINSVLHNVIYVATQHDSVYAFDADANPCVQLWKVSLIDTLHGGTGSEAPVPCNEATLCVVGAGYGDIQPEIGVTGTPVIDPTTSTIYVVSKSWNANSSVFYQRLHALDMVTGMTEKFSGPVTITASVPGIGDGSATVTFSPKMEHQRPALALANGTVYVSWAAHEDATPYHGWLMGYSAANLLLPPSVFNTTPNGGLGGIWGGGGAPAIDNGGDVYVTTGNGVFDESPPSPTNDYGDSILRLHPSTAGSTPNGVDLNVEGWFTPYDQSTLAQFDTDLGSGAAVLLPDQGSAPTHLFAQLGKEGVVYLIDRDNMGQFDATNNSQIIQSFSGTSGGLWGTPAFWQNSLYFGGQGDSLRAYAFTPGSPPQFATTASSYTSGVFNFPGSTPSISSQASSNGIVWAIDASQYGPPAPGPGPAIVHAYSANALGTEYWNSSQASGNRDQAGNAVKFVPPTIANGKVYVSTRAEIDVYGFLP